MTKRASTHQETIQHEPKTHDCKKSQIIPSWKWQSKPGVAPDQVRGGLRRRLSPAVGVRGRPGPSAVRQAHRPLGRGRGWSQGEVSPSIFVKNSPPY